MRTGGGRIGVDYEFVQVSNKVIPRDGSGAESSMGEHGIRGDKGAEYDAAAISVAGEGFGVGVVEEVDDGGGG